MNSLLYITVWTVYCILRYKLSAVYYGMNCLLYIMVWTLCCILLLLKAFCFLISRFQPESCLSRKIPGFIIKHLREVEGESKEKRLCSQEGRWQMGLLFPLGRLFLLSKTFSFGERESHRPHPVKPLLSAMDSPLVVIKLCALFCLYQGGNPWLSNLFLLSFELTSQLVAL